MRLLKSLFDNNRQWAERSLARDPEFFHRLSEQQAPEFLWIGCSDSRVPANEIIGLQPGEVFVHRNVANIVHPADINCLSVLQYAVDVLQVRHVMVVGHYGCGGVKAVLEDEPHGLIDHWLSPVRELRRRNEAELARLPDLRARWQRLCEWNVIAQTSAVAQSVILRRAWAQFRPVAVHGWIYDLRDGRLRDLDVTVASEKEAEELRDRAPHAGVGAG